MPTFGKTAIGASALAVSDPFDIRGCGPYAIATGATATKISLYAAGGPTSSTQAICAIYSDSAGVPGTLQGQASAQVTIPQSAAGAWYDFTLSPNVSLAAGSYWIFFRTNGTQITIQHDTTAGVNEKGSNAGTFTAFPGWPASYPVPDFSNSNFDDSLYVTYTIASAFVDLASLSAAKVI